MRVEMPQAHLVIARAREAGGNLVKQGNRQTCVPPRARGGRSGVAVGGRCRFVFNRARGGRTGQDLINAWERCSTARAGREVHCLPGIQRATMFARWAGGGRVQPRCSARAPRPHARREESESARPGLGTPGVRGTGLGPHALRDTGLHGTALRSTGLQGRGDARVALSRNVGV